MKICVLISGGGSNLQALIDAGAKPGCPFQIARVISNVPSARGLERARAAGIACVVVDHTTFDQRSAFDHAIEEAITNCAPDLVVLAGFMRIVGQPVLAAYGGRMINLHPSLLPRHPGTDTYARALSSGDREHGASIHFVTEQLDGGPVIAQVRIPILDGDNPAALQARLAPEEHRLITAVVELFARRPVTCGGDRVILDGDAIPKPLELYSDGSLH